MKLANAGRAPNGSYLLGVQAPTRNDFNFGLSVPLVCGKFVDFDGPIAVTTVRQYSIHLPDPFDFRDRFTGKRAFKRMVDGSFEVWGTSEEFLY
jgi:hypothetical protein